MHRAEAAEPAPNALKALFTPFSDKAANAKLLALCAAGALSSVATLIHDTYLPIYLSEVLGLSNTKVRTALFLSTASQPNPSPIITARDALSALNDDGNPELQDGNPSTDRNVGLPLRSGPGTSLPPDHASSQSYMLANDSVPVP